MPSQSFQNGQTLGQLFEPLYIYSTMYDAHNPSLVAFWTFPTYATPMMLPMMSVVMKCAEAVMPYSHWTGAAQRETQRAE